MTFWQMYKRTEYPKRFQVPLPSHRICPGPGFEAALGGIAEDGERMYAINERIDDLALHLGSSGAHNPVRLGVRQLGAKAGISTHAFRAGAPGTDDWVYFHIEDDRYVLDDIGEDRFQ
jgi:hypothetical protein